MKLVKVLVQTRYKGQPVRPSDPEFSVDDVTAVRWEEKKICKILGDTVDKIDPIDLTSKKNDDEFKAKQEAELKKGQLLYAAPQPVKTINLIEIEEAKREADSIGVVYAHNISLQKLLEKISQKKSEMSIESDSLKSAEIKTDPSSEAE